MDELSRTGGRNCYGDVYAGGQAQVIVGNVYQQTSSAELTEEHSCHQVFKTSPYEKYKDRNPPRVAGTCRWALDHQRFLDWRNSSQNALLWISADPGCGKSVLSKALVDEEFPSGSPSTVCYFFFKDNEEQDNLDTALSALLHQVFSQQPHLLCHAIPAWKENGGSLRQETREMWRILQASAADSSANPIVCILDALDECKDVDRRQLIEMLCDLQNYTQHSSSTSILKVLATSRPYDNVQRWFERTTSTFPQIRLRGEDENDQIHQEINLVIEQRLQDLTQEFDLSSVDSERLRQQLLCMQHRTYLWLYLAMEEVREVCRDSIYGEEIRIVSLPTSVEDAYERILCKIKDRQRTLARRILLIVVGARRPLSIEEMAKALGAARANELNQSCISRIEPRRLEKQIREQCGLFVFINHSQLFLIHQTAKEFLVAQSTNVDTNAYRWKSCLQEAQVEDEMTVICMTYLSLYDKARPRSKSDSCSDADPQALEETDWFFRYCAEHWTSHLRDESVQSSEDLLGKVLVFHARDSDLFHTWFPIMWEVMYGRCEVPTLYPQHSIAITGHSFVLQKILDNDSEGDVLLNAKDSTGSTALHWAAKLGHRGVVQVLLDRGADIDTKDGYNKTALNLASYWGYTELVQTLLDAGADVNASNHYSDTALLEVAKRGFKDIAQFLINASANINACDENGKIVLIEVSRWGYNELVQILLNAGAAVDIRDEDGWTALMQASTEGHEKVVQTLLNAGAAVNISNMNGWTPLMRAAVAGHKKVVQILLDGGANVNDGNDSGSALLIWASAHAYEDLVRIQLDGGLDVNASDDQGYTALMWASERGHKKVVQMLLDGGASVNASDNEGWTALTWASGKGHEKVVQMLLDAGANVDIRLKDSTTSALQMASRNGHEGVIQILLAAYLKSDDGALIDASRMGNKEMVQGLLGAGADVTAELHDKTALQWASRGGYGEIVQILLDADADVNAGSGIGNTALMGASRQGHVEVVQILLDAGADVHAGFLGQTALLLAEAEGHEEVVQLLLEYGAKEMR